MLHLQIETPQVALALEKKMIQKVYQWDTSFFYLLLIYLFLWLLCLFTVQGEILEKIKFKDLF